MWRYTYAGPTPRGVFNLPPRDRVPHAQTLAAQLQGAKAHIDAAHLQQPPANEEVDGYPLTVRSDAGYELKLESLDRRRDGMELLSVRKVDQISVASIFVQRDKLVKFLGLISDFETKDSVRTDKHGVVHSKPKNQALIQSIASIQLAVVRDLWGELENVPFPPPDQAVWWEAWLRTASGEPAEIFDHFNVVAHAAGLITSQQFVCFPERLVLLVWGTSQQLGQSVDVLSYLAELRKAKEIPTEYLELAPRDQQAFVDDAITRLVGPGHDAPAVCLLDTGVNRQHPLLAPVLHQADTQAVDPQWGTADHDPDQHGTGMAGIASFGCLTEVFTTNGPLRLRHCLESVKLLPPPPGANAPEVYGWVTQQAVAKAELQAPNRNRAICMAVTSDDRDQGLPSSWSAAVDQMCSGVLDDSPKLMFISTGNFPAVLDDPAYIYADWNTQRAGIQDPSQAWNAVTVGAYTERVFIQDAAFQGWNPIAGAGDLSPTSRTSLPWPPDRQRGWPIKPEIVMEGGNYVCNGIYRSNCPDLSLLTTIVHPTGRLLSNMGDTSAATASAARLAAILWSHYPTFRPETVRAILVHSAEWTPAMCARFPGNAKADVQRRLRCFGYGVPRIKRALYSAENAATLIYEGELQPFQKVGSVIKTKEMHLHHIPWPKVILQQLGEVPVSMHITLSYFIEPGPGRKGWGRKHRFQSHGLRFDVIHPLDTEDDFKKRISKAAREDPDEGPDNIEDDRNWAIGYKGRTHGSIHSDWWEGTASELAQCNRVAVYPVTGWWRERPHLNKWDSMARYSLVISIETPDVEVDLYTPIVNQAMVSTELVV